MLDRADYADFACHNSIRLEAEHFLNTLALTIITFSLFFASDPLVNCIPDAKRGYYGFIIVVVRVRRDFLLATYSPHFFPDFFHIWQVAWYAKGLATVSFW